MADKTPADHLDELENIIRNEQHTLKQDRLYYDALWRPTSVGLAVPEEMRHFLAQIEWSALFVNSIAERLEPTGFRMGGSDEADDRLWDWWQANFLDVDAVLGFTEAMIHGRAYLTISAPDPVADVGMDPEVPIIRVESPMTMWAEEDPRTKRITRAARVIFNPENQGEAIAGTLYMPEATYYFEKEHSGPWTMTSVVEHNLGVVPVVPLVNRSTLSDTRGRSLISPGIRSLTDAASRIMMDMQGAAELMAIPQRLLFGVSKEALEVDPSNPNEVFQAYIARILAFEDPEGKAQQFTAAELRNYVDVLEELAKHVAAYTGLPPQYLAFSSENPASAEAIKASESRLIKMCERMCRMFGGNLEQAMRIAILVMDGAIPHEAYRMETVWADPGTPTFASKADAVVKLATAQTPDGRPILPVEQARQDLGYSDTVRKRMENWDKNSPMNQLGSIARMPLPPRERDGDSEAE